MKVLRLTIDMIQRRDDMRRLLGQNYAVQANQSRQILRSAVIAWDLPIAECALKIAKNMSDHGHDPSIVIAALVDECEATEKR